MDLHIGVGLQTGLVLCKLEDWCGLINSSELMWACRLVWSFLGLQTGVGLCGLEV